MKHKLIIFIFLTFFSKCLFYGLRNPYDCINISYNFISNYIDGIKYLILNFHLHFLGNYKNIF